MSLYNRLLRMSRPRTFLYLMSLRTGTELSTLTLLFNKVSGFYGLLALLTGLHLSPLQLSMYIYSLLALFLIVSLARHIRTQSPLECLALAYFFILDSVINALYTAAFGMTWFLVLSGQKGSAAASAGGGKMMDQAAGFTDPEFNVSHVEVVTGQKNNEALVVGHGKDGIVERGAGAGVHGVMQPEGLSSIVVILALWAVRVYLVLVVMSYARLVLRRHVMGNAGRNVQLHSGSRDRSLMENPFAAHLPEGKGWRGRLGRALTRLGKGYWLGAEEGDEGWMYQEMGRKGSRHAIGSPDGLGIGERERRRRNGAGPPNVQIPMQGQQPAKHSRLQEVRGGK